MHVVTLNMGEATHCQKDFKSCFILTFKNLFDSARSADDVCRTIDGLIAEEFKTPFSNDNLKNALMSFIPIFQAREMDWGRLFCDKFLPMAKLHNKCSQGGSSGAGGGIEGRINGPSVKEEIPIEESLH